MVTTDDRQESPPPGPAAQRHPDPTMSKLN